MIDLTVADPDLPTPEAVVEGAVAALRAGDTHYPPTGGRPRLRLAIAARHERSSGRRVGPENVLVTPGAQCALYLAARSLAGPGDHLAAIEPYYLNYPATLAATGAEVGFIRTQPDADFRVREEAIAAAIRPNTKAIVFSNPNNPTGCRLRHEEMRALATAALRRDLWLVCDEVYSGLCFEERFASLASLPLVGDRLVVLGSLSKSHAMTGWRAGWMIAPEPLVAQAERLADIVYHGLPGFIQEAAALAVEDASTPREAVEIYRCRRDAFAGALGASPAIVPRIPQAGPFMLCDIRATGLSGARFVRLAAAEAGVALVDGGRFGRSSAGFVRAALTRPEAVLVEAAQRLSKLSHRLSKGVHCPPSAPAEAALGALASGARESEPEFAEGVYISASGTVYVCRDGAIDEIC
jgi:aspartate/methionine/tyrosine aminotransferase